MLIIIFLTIKVGNHYSLKISCLKCLVPGILNERQVKYIALIFYWLAWLILDLEFALHVKSSMLISATRIRHKVSKINKQTNK